MGVSHAAPKNHFGDKAGLFAAIAVEGFQRLVDEFTIETEAVHDAPLALGIRYVRFALEHPAHFAVMWNPALHHEPLDVVTARDASFKILLAALDDGDTESPVSVARGERAWIVAHGLATLLLNGSLTPPPGTDPMLYVRQQLGRFDFDDRP